MEMPVGTLPLVEQVRSFNRTMTERIGVLNDHFLGRDHPLGEARLIWEIGEQGATVRALRRRFFIAHTLFSVKPHTAGPLICFPDLLHCPSYLTIIR